MNHTDHYIFLQRRQLIVDAPVTFTGDEPSKEMPSATAHTDASNTPVILTGVFYGETPLSASTDFVYAAPCLTISKQFLLTLPSSPLGETAVLRCTFSDGTVRSIHVIQFDTPQLMPLRDHVKEGLMIPVECNGDIPLNKIFCQQKHGGFAPIPAAQLYFSPEASAFILTPTFLAGRNGDTLRFHFLSGHKAVYRLPIKKRRAAGNRFPLREIKRAWREPLVKVLTGGIGVMVLAGLAKCSAGQLKKKKR